MHQYFLPATWIEDGEYAIFYTQIPGNCDLYFLQGCILQTVKITELLVRSNSKTSKKWVFPPYLPWKLFQQQDIQEMGAPSIFTMETL